MRTDKSPASEFYTGGTFLISFKQGAISFKRKVLSQANCYSRKKQLPSIQVPFQVHTLMAQNPWHKAQYLISCHKEVETLGSSGPREIRNTSGMVCFTCTECSQEFEYRSAASIPIPRQYPSRIKAVQVDQCWNLLEGCLDHLQVFGSDLVQSACYSVSKGLKSLQVAAVCYWLWWTA